MQVKEGKGLLTHTYGSLREFADYQLEHPGYKGLEQRSESSNRKFAGVNSMAEAAERAYKGLPESGVKVLRASRKLAHSAVQQVNRTTLVSTYDVAGSYVDMGRFIEGTPECMVDYLFDTTPVINPVVKIASNVNASGGVPKSELEKRGKLVVALIKAIETSGRSTELWIDSTNESYDGKHVYRIAVQIKRPAQPLDMGAVMYAFTDPSMLRALMFNAMHALPKALYPDYGVGHGYGKVPRGKLRVEECYGNDCVYLPAVHLYGDNAETTVTNVLTDLGIG
jgi:hypothetical protein